MFHSSGCNARRYFLFMTLSPHSRGCLAGRSKSVITGEGSPGLGSPCSSGSMERPLKAGWLKKQQRSLVKNWQQRYFVLRGSTLTYHKDDKETTVRVRHWQCASCDALLIGLLITHDVNVSSFVSFAGINRMCTLFAKPLMQISPDKFKSDSCSALLSHTAM